MRELLPFVILLLAAGSSIAGDGRMSLVYPKGTGLTLVERDRKHDSYAKFSGQTWVTGTFVGRWSAGATNFQDKSPDYVLVPDSVSVSKLPYWFLREPPYFNRYRVESIELVNGKEALRKAVGLKDAKRLLERRVNAVRSTGAFLIQDYVVGVDCDAPWAKAKLVKARLPDQVASKHGKVPEGC